MRKLSEEEVVDIIYGCAILGTGGGGNLKDGLEIIRKDFDEGREFIMVDLDEVPDDEYVAVAYECGALDTNADEDDEKYGRFKLIDTSQTKRAFEAMEEYFGQDFYGVISTELGAENTAEAFHTAVSMNRKIIDGDLAGRSVPGIEHTTFNLHNVPIQPIALASKFGDTMIINNVVDDFRAETIIRKMAEVSSNVIGVADHPVKGRILKKSVIPGAISYAGKIGRELREARLSGRDPVETIVEANKGKILFMGQIVEAVHTTENGYTIGDFTLSGSGSFEGEDYNVWYKNENIISYRNGLVDVTVPDLICVLDSNGVPLNNPYAEKGVEVTVFALPAPKEWLTDKGLAILGPKSFGFDIEYRPFDNI